MAKPLGITLPISLGSSGYFSNTTDTKVQIKSNLTNLLLTRKGERPFQPEFGCNIYRALFEPNTDESLAQAHAEIQSAISLWMPFITIENIRTQSQNADGHSLIVEISYRVLTNNITDTIILVF